MFEKLNLKTLRITSYQIRLTEINPGASLAL